MIVSIAIKRLLNRIRIIMNSEIGEIAHKAVSEWFGYQDEVELELALRVVAKENPKVILEIGTAYNASLAAWAAVCKPDLAIGMDPLTLPKTPEQQKSFDNLVETYDLKIIPYTSRLPEAHRQLDELLKGRKVDFLFIDGEHRYDDVRYDFYEYLKYMNKPSIVGLHDIYYSDQTFDSGAQASFLWDRLKKKYDYDEFHYHSSMGIGILYLK